MILQANAFKIPLADKSVHCPMTSPPYYSLRKYAGEQEFIFGGDKDCVHEWGERRNITKQNNNATGKSTLNSNPAKDVSMKDIAQATTGQLCHKCNAWRGAYGLEPTLQMYVDHTVEWCREVWRVLRDDGTFWLNLGDSYAGSGGPGGDYERMYVGKDAEKIAELRGNNPNKTAANHGLKPKDLMGVPWRVALALQADGWYLRSDIIWHKPNPMPESVTDRPTKSHEYLFLLTKSKTYYYDADAVREKYDKPLNRWGGPKTKETDKNKGDEFAVLERPGRERRPNSSGRNKRTVWTIATAPYSGAHFATFPPALVEPCIKAGTSEHGVCPECGNPWERVVEKKIVPGPKAAKTFVYDERDIEGHATNDQGSNRARDGHKPGHITAVTTLGWRPTCSEYDHLYRSEFPQARNARKRYQQDIAGYWWKRVRQRPGKAHWKVLPATILDPFSGSATTLLVARKLGRRGIGLDISAEYLDLAKERLSIKALEEWENGKVVPELDTEGLPLFNV